MNGLRTRNHLHHAFRTATPRERQSQLDSFEAMLAKLCAVGLVVIMIMNIVEMVAA